MIGRRVAVRRGPGLLRTMAGTAVVAGTASAVRHGVDRRMDQRDAQRDAEAFAAQDAMVDRQMTRQQSYQQQVMQQVEPQSVDPNATLSQLKTLGDLRAQGILTEAEFEVQKAKILG